jgi:DNA repair protein RecO (recombination protein O)
MRPNNQAVTHGIVLARTNFGEADKIVTLITPDHGKLRVIAKGVRRSKSKLAAGIELFSVSEITFIRGRGDISTLVSARLQTHYGDIVKILSRTMAGYDLIKILHKVTEDEPEKEYFELMHTAFESLNDPSISELLIRNWFSAQLLRQTGHEPNLSTDIHGKKLRTNTAYEFSHDDMAFVEKSNGIFDTNSIKFLRLLFSPNHPKVLARVENSDKLSDITRPLIITMAAEYLHV